MLNPQDDLIDLTPDVEEGSKIPPLFENTPAALAPDVATQRAGKAAFGLQGKIPPEQIQAAINNGTEDEVRVQAARGQDLEDMAHRQQIVSDYVKTSKDKPTPQAAGVLQDVLQHRPNDPNTIFEQKYANKYMDYVMSLSSSNEDAQQEFNDHPDEVADTSDRATWALRNKEIAQKAVEGLEAEWKGSPILSKAENITEQFVPFYSWIMQSNAIDNSSIASDYLPGNNVKQQYDYLLSLPPAEYQKTLSTTLDKMKAVNPLEAIQFAKGLTGYSTSDAALSNLYALGDIAGVAAGETALGAAGKATGIVKSFTRAGKEAKAVEGLVQHFNVTTTGAKINPDRVKDFISGKIDIDSLSDVEQQFVKTMPKSYKEMQTNLKASGTFKDVVQEAGRRTTTPEDVVAATGNLDRSAEVATLSQAKSVLSGKDPLRRGKTLFQEVKSIMDPQVFDRGASRFSQGAVNDIINHLADNASSLVRAITEPSSLNRLSESVEQLAVENTRNTLKQSYSRLSDSILDVSPDLRLSTNGDHDVTNTLHAAIQLGKPDKTLFDSPEQAALWAKDMYELPPNSFRLGKLGNGSYIEITKPVDETDYGLRNLLQTTESKSQESNLIGTLLSRVRTPDEVLSPLERANRKALVHATQEVSRLIAPPGKDIGKLNNTSKAALNRVLEANRDAERTVVNAKGDTEIQRGEFYNSIGDFEQGFAQINSRFPTVKETKAYFAAVQLNDIDYVVRNMGLYRDKIRQGIENFTFSIKDAKGKVIKGPRFEGKSLDKLPDEAQDAGIAVLNEDSAEWNYYRKNRLTDDQHADISRKQEEGYKWVQVANGGDKPLSKVTGVEDTINYVLVRTPENTPLEWKQIPYKAGGHVDYNTQWFVKQGKFRQTSYGATEYNGDTSILTFSTQAQAQKFSKRLETARQMYEKLIADPNSDYTELYKYVKGNLPWSPKQFRSLFEDQVSSGGKITQKAKLSPHEKIDAVPSQKGMNDHLRAEYQAKHGNFEDNVDSVHNLYRNIDKKFAGQRDTNLQTVAESGTEDNPILKLDTPRLVDPLTSLSKSAANIIRNRHMADYIHSSIEHFVSEFADVLRIENGESIWTNPRNLFYTQKWSETADFEKLQAAKAVRNAILHLIGEPTESAKRIQWVQNKLLDSIYNKAGAKTSDWMADHTIARISDPFRFARAIAFHSKLGLFNINQYFVQTQSMAHAWAILPQHAYHAVTGGIFMRRLAMRPDDVSLIDHMAGLAANMGWKKEHFIESWNELRKTGLLNVKGDVAWLDDVSGPLLFRPGNKLDKVGNAVEGAADFGGKVLDAGTMFFNEAERQIRLNAWNLAYREWKKANPYKLIGNRERNQILARQNLLSVNMTRDANASYQKGILAIPAQFFGYQARLSEQLLGKRLTKWEKARVTAMYSAMYGMPTALGAWTAVWPWQDTFRQAAQERNINLDNKFIETLSDGLPAMAIEMMGGPDLNIAERYGPGGLRVMHDLLSGDTSGRDLVLGASGNIIGQMLQSLDPAFQLVENVVRPENAKYPFIAQDFYDAARNISTVNNFATLWYAANYGKFITRNGINVTGMDTLEGLMFAVTGLSPQAISDAFLRAASNKEVTAVQQEAQNQITKYIHRAMQAKTPEESQRYIAAARAHLIGSGILPSDVEKVLERAFKDQGSLIDGIDRKFYMQGPADSYKERMEKYQEMQQEGNQ